MITKITKEQEALIPQYIQKWVDLASQPIDRTKVKEIFKKIYKEDKIIIVGESFQNTIDLVKVATEGKKLEYDSQLYLQLSSQLGSQLYSQLRSQLGLQLGSQLYSQLYLQLGSQLRSQLYSQLSSQLSSQLDSQLGSQLDSQNIKYSSYMSYYLYDWAGFYDYAEKIGVNFDKKSLDRYFEILLNIPIVIFVGNVIFVCEKPKCYWANQRLHSEHFPAISWKDETGFYFLNGVSFPKDLWLKIISREMEMDEILKITDIDQRVQAMKFAKNGLRDFYKSQNGKMIDSYDKLDIQARPVHYELWEIPQGEIFNKIVHFAVYDCPTAKARGEQREYSKGVPAFKTVAEAMSWGMSSEDNTVSPKTWRLMVPLVHES